MASIRSDVEVSDPWRKAGFDCKPYNGEGQEEAKRFAKHILDAADGKEYSSQAGAGPWTAGDVFRGDHEGGINNPIVAPQAATRANKQRARDTRNKQTMTYFLKHILVETLKDFYRTSFAADPKGALDHFIANEAGGETAEPKIQDIKAQMQGATIIGVAGYRLGSIHSFAMHLTALNGTITDANERVSEHDIAVMVLDKISKASVGGISQGI